MLKNHLASLNRKQIDEYNDKLKMARLSDQQHGQEMAQIALAEDQRQRLVEKQKRNDYSEALKSEVQAREKMKALD